MSKARAAVIAAEIAARLADVSFALPGTLADWMTGVRIPRLPLPRRPPQRHGPYHQWTRKKNGKTATRILSDERLADYGPWFDNHRRLRELITILEALSLAIAEADPAGTASQTRPARASPGPQNPNSALRITWAEHA